eukprot:6212543-Pleurochrysis_carterae.AAC.2
MDGHLKRPWEASADQEVAANRLIANGVARVNEERERNGCREASSGLQEQLEWRNLRVEAREALDRGGLLVNHRRQVEAAAPASSSRRHGARGGRAGVVRGSCGGRAGVVR